MNTDTDRRQNDNGVGNGDGDDDSTKAAPTSQIPGLSDDANNGPEERTKGRRTGVNESDSAYTKLAKQGGQRGKNGLLWHEETNLDTKPNSASSYKAPNWFSGSPKAQEQASPTESFQNYMSTNAPFGSDNKSTWERDFDDKEKISPNSQMENLSLASGKNEDAAGNFKKTPAAPLPIDGAEEISQKSQNSTPVNMSTLLSFGYLEDQKGAPNTHSSSSKE
ncbi:uncharacterized protein C7orf57 homolog isoform X1 [Oncorhynchus nerka]|uniref:uncharacterized protein C7orf57 homolog isoform X1 n=1 Tax=Oncorhynchus nerka TaxID=8023 RepID=UPI001130B129|nr:uncharacterized protein C7orf57 homolog isoform X1 [Oncorhynchus nerka]XP_035606087.1 uncharacterized protein C7orf57 homolog isoform X1 [Oncorhynchus keta]XP_046218771.1 uncharacterized protein C7orf57 homolog isoform X1 [Oncorhynchus gorbuscha]